MARQRPCPAAEAGAARGRRTGGSGPGVGGRLEVVRIEQGRRPCRLLGAFVGQVREACDPCRPVLAELVPGLFQSGADGGDPGRVDASRGRGADPACALVSLAGGGSGGDGCWGAGGRRRVGQDDPELYPLAGRVWADWLYGEHSPAHRRQILDEFASDFVGGTSDIPAVLRVLSSVKVLGEGMDTAECDAVLFADARGSMVDIVQMVGRALRTRPGRGKLATLIVPVFLEPGEKPDEMASQSWPAGPRLPSQPVQPSSPWMWPAIQALTATLTMTPYRSPPLCARASGTPARTTAWPPVPCASMPRSRWKYQSQ
ncbi:helicase-related protein (plasmid) [Streptomyces sp. NBC_01591]|uniref:helicase-related protein n=1 Tax=Streptomyces sp. NBC_01591 TaxID=2975888 RepID=UPI002DDC60B0|nr:helicase-related protein [Streptomyces sp. NBC_01591]WSD74184.1 helicase-related protein [Streptomyces sp. NBC_01591]